MTRNPDHDPFRATFDRLARRTRVRFFARYALHGVGAGGLAASVVVAACARWGPHVSTPLVACAACAGVALGVAASAVAERRRRWSDAEIALFFDGRLATSEAIVTALEVPSAAVARGQAATALAKAPRAALAVRVLQRSHAALGLAVAALVLATRVPRARVDVPPKEPGASAVVIGRGSGLERVERLASLPARDPAQHERLAALAKDAKKLREDLTKGLPVRDAQDRTAKLAEAVRAERATLGSGEERKGLEAAIAALTRDDKTRRAAEALGDHDLRAMDRELEHQANAREAADRRRAREALEAARAAARGAGAPLVAKALEDTLAKAEKREARARLLRELAKALGTPKAKEGLEKLDRAPGDTNAKALADALADALEGLSEADRKKLAEALAKKAGNEGSPLTAKELEALAKELATPEGREALARRLRELASRDDTTDEETRDEGLSEAEQGLEGAEDALGQGGQQGGGLDGGAASQGGQGPQGGQGAGVGVEQGGAPGTGAGAGPSGGQGDGQGSGSHHDTGRGAHGGETAPIAGGGFKARAKGPSGSGPLMPGTTTAWKPGEAQGTADAVGPKALEAARAAELEGAERGDVPEDYREQIHRYFRP